MQVKRGLTGIATLILGAGAAIAMAGSVTTAATAAPSAYPGKNGLIAFVRSNQVYTISSAGAWPSS